MDSKKKYQPSSNKNGFSLIELALTLVILGLIIGATVVGREMLHAAELRAVISEVENYKLIIDNFETQYEGLPGDLKNAESYWGTYNNPSNLTGTINGNNNGKINDDETFRAWHQLFRARLISGTYTSGNDSNDDASLGSNVPQSEYLNNAGFSLAWVTSPGSWTDQIGRSYSSNYIIIGSETTGSHLLTSASLKPEDARSIDGKIDNEKGDSGKVLAIEGNGQAANSCIDTTASNSFNTANNTPTCILYISIQ